MIHNEAHAELERVAELQGWNDESRIIHLTAFISQYGGRSVEDFMEYLGDVAAEENEGIAPEPEPEMIP